MISKLLLAFKRGGDAGKIVEGDGSSKIHLILRMALRVLQFVLSLAAIGLYASELKAVHFTVRYKYAVVVATLSAITSLVFLIPKVKSFLAFAWDFILFILWIGVFGSMGRYFINPKSQTSAHDTKMRNAVWLDIIIAGLWFISFVAGGVLFWKHRRNNSAPVVARV